MCSKCTLHTGRQRLNMREFPGDPVAGALCFHYRGSDMGSEILRALHRPKKKKKISKT